jgi:diguanylate cyclase (GGDEF)-like protein
MIHVEDLAAVQMAVDGAIESGSPFTVQHRIVRPDGAIRTVILRGCVLPDLDGGPGRLVGTTQDVTGKLGLEEQLWHLANEDSLTGLYNRRRFLDELAREIAVAHRTGTVGAVLMLDLDRFKDVNDWLGHAAGDRLLAEVAGGLRARLRSTDTLARLGGDEFAAVLPACPTAEARAVASDLAVAAGAPTRIAGRLQQVTASVGVAPFGTRGGESADSVLVEADLAMYAAKRSSAGSTEVFDEEMRMELAARLATGGGLRAAA